MSRNPVNRLVRTQATLEASPPGLAFKLPEDIIGTLIKNDTAVPLKHFPNRHVKDIMHFLESLISARQSNGNNTFDSFTASLVVSSITCRHEHRACNSPFDHSDINLGIDTHCHPPCKLADFPTIEGSIPPSAFNTTLSRLRDHDAVGDKYSYRLTVDMAHDYYLHHLLVDKDLFKKEKLIYQ